MNSSPNNFDLEATLIFHATPYEGGVVPFAALGFCWIGERLILANIKNRGWCVPSGRIEAGESPLDAIAREALEECGVQSADWRPFGWFEVNEQKLCRVSLAFVCTDPDWDGTPLGDDSTSAQAFNIAEISEVYYDWNTVTKQTIQASLKAATRLR